MTKRQYSIKIAAVTAVLLLQTAGRANTIAEIIGRPNQKNTEFSILAVRADDGTVLYRRNSDKPMIPASNMKIITSAAALHYLGADYEYRTRLAMLGDDLVVIGGGDPVLGDTTVDQRHGRTPNWIVEQIIHTLQQRGVKQVNNLIVDSFFFDLNRVHPSWPADQHNRAYACETCGLNYNRNCVRITAARQGGVATLAMEPNNDYLTLINQLRQINSGNSAIGGYRTNTPNRVIVRGNLNQRAGFDLAIENPAGLFANVLAGALRQAGIAVNGQILQQYVQAEPDLKILHTFTNGLWDVLERCNKDSLNLTAESLIKTISAEHTQGRINGEWPHGLALAGQYLNTLGLDEAHYHLDDGSGLSRQNRLSCRVVTTVLRDMYQKPYADRYMATLAEAGNDGTIQRFFQQAPYRGNIQGKTGYISNVRTFSGVCRTPRGDIIFAILTQGGSSATRGAINDIAKAIFDGSF